MQEAGNLTTAEGLETLKAELETLEGAGRRDIAERIKTAREWGDLEENSEYHDAKNEQAHLETKIARLREKIAQAVIVEEDGAGAILLHDHRLGDLLAQTRDLGLEVRLLVLGVVVLAVLLQIAPFARGLDPFGDVTAPRALERL